MEDGIKDALKSLGNLEIPIEQQTGEIPTEPVVPESGDTPPTEPINTNPPVIGEPPVSTDEPLATEPVNPVTPTIPPTNTTPPTPSQNDILKEIFGDRFSTVEEAKQANISSALDEVNTLRQEKINLEEQLSKKPKTDFVNDEVALFNEFVKNTGQNDFGLFKKINSADFANMDSMDAIVTQYILENPKHIGNESNVKAYFQERYNINPDLVDETQLSINQVGVDSAGAKAKAALQEIKAKLTVPEPAEEPTAPKKLSAEELNQLKTGWSKVGQDITQKLAKLKIPVKGSKNPLFEYTLDDAEQNEIVTAISKYASENQMELNDDNVKSIGAMAYNQLMINKLPDIIHATVEKVRNMTAEEIDAQYTNPSPVVNTDAPPVQMESPETKREKVLEQAYQKALGSLG